MKKLLVVFLIIIVVLGCYGYLSMDMYTDDEHLNNVKDKFSNRWFHKFVYEDGSKPENFSAYKLYDKNEELIAILIEMEPHGFEFIKIRDDSKINEVLFSRYSCYVRSLNNYGFDETWQRYIVNGNTGNLEPICDENGVVIDYRKSPYSVSGNANERKYLLETISGYYIPAVKKGGEFINLISGQSININVSKQELYDNHKTLFINFSIKFTL